MAQIILSALALLSFNVFSMEYHKKKPRIAEQKHILTKEELVFSKNIFGGIVNSDQKSIEIQLNKAKKAGLNTGRILNIRARIGLNLLPLEEELLKNNPQLSLVELLLSEGADPNIPLEKNANLKDDELSWAFEGWTAAHFAVYLDVSPKILAMLYKYNANFLSKDEGDWTPLDVALHDKIESPSRYIFKHYGENLINYKVRFKTHREQNLPGFVKKVSDDRYIYDFASGIKKNAKKTKQPEQEIVNIVSNASVNKAIKIEDETELETLHEEPRAPRNKCREIMVNGIKAGGYVSLSALVISLPFLYAYLTDHAGWMR